MVILRRGSVGIVGFSLAVEPLRSQHPNVLLHRPIAPAPKRSHEADKVGVETNVKRVPKLTPTSVLFTT
jgi:hypothetical protein